MKTLKPEAAKKRLFDVFDTISDDKASFFKNPQKDFSRVQKISFHDTMLYPMVADNNNTSVEILDYFPADSLPTPAALSYRRAQLKVDAYEAAFRRFTAQIPREKKYHGFHLIACDGTGLNTPYNPSDTESFSQCIRNRKGFNQNHLTICYDLLNGCFTDVVIQGYRKMNEKRAFVQMMDRYPEEENPLFIVDRGFGSFNIMFHACSNGQSFLLRADKQLACGLFHDTDLSETDIADLEDEVNIGRRRTKAMLQLKNYHCITKKRTYDHIGWGENGCDTLRLRLLKFPISENSYEYIITNLPKKRFSLEKIRELYGLRWGIETSFRYLKYAQGLIHIHSLKREFILQEIYAKLTAYNFCAAVSAETTSADHNKTTKYTYQTDRSYLIKVCVRFLKGKVRDISPLLQRKRVPVRPNRTFKRKLGRQAADTLQYR